MKSIPRFLLLLLLPLLAVSFFSAFGCDGPRVKVRKPKVSLIQNNNAEDDSAEEENIDIMLIPGGSGWDEFGGTTDGAFEFESFGGTTDSGFSESLFDDNAGTTDFSF